MDPRVEDVGDAGRADLLGIMPKLIVVTPEEARVAERIAGRLRAASRMCPQVDPLSRTNAARLTVGVSLPLGDLYFLLTWLEHMAGGLGQKTCRRSWSYTAGGFSPNFNRNPQDRSSFMLTQNRIYQPTEEEIVTTLGRAACRAPSLRSRLNRAGDLLRDHALCFERGEWFCDCAADPDGDTEDIHKTYRVDFATCECPDCRMRRAVVGGAAYCKHLMALLAYRRICLDHLESRLLGSMNDPGAYQASRRAPNAALLLFDKIEPLSLALYAWAEENHMRPRWVCSLARTGHDLAFASPGHLGAFAEWLRGAQPLPPELEALVLYRRLRELGFEEDDAAGAADAALVPLRMAA